MICRRQGGEEQMCNKSMTNMIASQALLSMLMADVHGVSPDPKPLHRATALRKDRICQKCAALHLNQATSMAHPQCLYSIIYSQKFCDVSCRVAEQQKQWYMYTPLCLHAYACNQMLLHERVAEASLNLSLPIAWAVWTYMCMGMPWKVTWRAC